ncbi:MMPL family transporter [Nocardia sp. NPDC101769]|uniref:MMPL family transporter n=1 Tax=Nocardia sp. NPDC101769 TaxID=3364333 RepID=UPI0038204DAB
MRAIGRRVTWSVAAFWVFAAIVAAMFAGKLGRVQNNDAAEYLPRHAESTQVADLMKRFVADNTYPAIVVYDHGGAPLTPSELTRTSADAARLATLPQVVGQVIGPIQSPDGQAVQLVVPLTVSHNGINDLPPILKTMRSIVAGSDMTVHITGPAGYGADSADAFGTVGTTLLLVTALVVVAILLFTYRSPVLWLLPLICVGVAMTVAQALIYLLVAHAGLTANGDSEFLLTVLVFGVGTDYALLLTARYREELHRHEDRYVAMRIALRRSWPTITASAITVALGLACLLFAVMQSTRSLGPVLAIGVLVTFAVMSTLYPAVLVWCGRWIFWPARPHYDTATASTDGGRRRMSRLIATRPRAVWIVTAGVLAAFALGIFGLHPTGLPGQNIFRNHPESVRGGRIVADHFPGDTGAPLQIIGPADAAGRLAGLAEIPGITEVSTPVIHGDLAYLQATPATTVKATDIVDRLRASIHTVPGARVGGDAAVTLDMLRASHRDQNVVIPLVLIVVALVMAILLRAALAPILILLTVVLSLAAAFGVSTLVFHYAFGFAGVDASFPLWAFVFLVSLGIDYSIFLAARIREESTRHDTRTAAVIAADATGKTITAAGLVLAGTFAALLTLPLVLVTEIGFAVAFGVLLDTFVVRTILVPALTVDLGDRIWWPNRPRNRSLPVAEPIAS